MASGRHACISVAMRKMAHDVHAALITILQQEGGLSSEQAAEFMTRLQQEKRYQRDVY